MELVVNAVLIYSSPAIYRTTKKHHSFSKLRKKNHRYCVCSGKECKTGLEQTITSLQLISNEA